MNIKRIEFSPSDNNREQFVSAIVSSVIEEEVSKSTSSSFDNLTIDNVTTKIENERINSEQTEVKIEKAFSFWLTALFFFCRIIVYLCFRK